LLGVDVSVGCISSRSAFGGGSSVFVVDSIHGCMLNLIRRKNSAGKWRFGLPPDRLRSMNSSAENTGCSEPAKDVSIRLAVSCIVLTVWSTVLLRTSERRVGV